MQIFQHPRVWLLSTVHYSTDPRIAGKIAPALSGVYEVKCTLTKNATGSINNEGETATITVLPHYRQLWKRLLFLYPVVAFQFIKFRPHIVHIFVAELLPIAFCFRWLGAKVIYEVQENLYKKIPTKSYNKNWFFERCFRFFDQHARQNFWLIFTENAYLTEYQQLAKPHALVQNFADTKWLTNPLPSPNVLQPTFFYAGVISFDRAIDTLIKAIDIVKQKFPNVLVKLFGENQITNSQMTEVEDTYQNVQNNLQFFGYLPQQEVFNYVQDAIAGIALLKPIGDYTDSYPTKMFDYMALGLPVLTSDLPLLKAVIEPNACGFCVTPTDANTLAKRMILLIENPDLAKQMGKNGRHAVAHKYNWQQEVQKLLQLYKTILLPT